MMNLQVTGVVAVHIVSFLDTPLQRDFHLEQVPWIVQFDSHHVMHHNTVTECETWYDIGNNDEAPTYLPWSRFAERLSLNGTKSYARDTRREKGTAP